MSRTKKPGERTVGTRAFNVFSYIFLIAFCLASLFPIFYAIMGSFKSNMDFMTGVGGLIPKTWHPGNYEKAWNAANFARYSFNSIYVTMCAIIGCTILTSMAGYVFARGDFPGRKFIMSMFLATMFLATGAITIYPIFSLSKSLHLNTSLWGLIIIYVFSINVANIYLVMGYVKGLPKEMDEAARIDGCGFFSTYLRVILPLCKPILATVALLTFKIAWNDYLMPMVFTLSNEELKTLTVGVVSLKSSGGGAGAYDMMLAGTAISLVPMIVFYSFTSNFFVSGITAGAVKG
jgi:multiple sugar transport system permease protein